MSLRSLALVAVLAASGSLRAADPVRVSLDFNTYMVQLDAPEGASVCQFHGADPVKQTISAARTYATVGGFPNDNGTTDFSRFCDVAFSTRGPQGMGLSQLWSTPSGFQTPQGSVGKHYSATSWKKLDFSMYHPDPLPPERYLSHDGKPVRGHTVPMLLAALKRARAENQRMLLWVDLHTDYPMWMWKDKLRRNAIPEHYWEEAVLHIVYYTKYLVSRYGVPIHTVSLQNEPDLPSRHQFTPEMLLKMSKLLRERLDEAGLHGVRIMPFTSFMLNKAWAPNHKMLVDTLSRAELLLRGEYASHQRYIDSLGGHLSHNEPPWQTKLPNVHFWRASGDFDTHWKPVESVIFDMGPDDQIDEVIRTNTWLYGQGVNLAGIWQVALRMGHTVDDFVMPEKFDIEKNFRHAAIDGAAAVFPFVRPGMFLVSGSLGRHPRDDFSVDAFAGRGHREAIVITNSRESREFRIRAAGLESFDVYQSVPGKRRQSLDPVQVVDGVITLRVPADSVTTLVSKQPVTRPAAYLVVRSASTLTPAEVALSKKLTTAGYDVKPVSETLTQPEQNTLDTKRHPVDPMGASIYILSPSITSPATLAAHKVAMAPVIAVGARNAAALGLKMGTRIAAGDPLSFRDPLDPPADMLESGLPKACGARVAVATLEGAARAQDRVLFDFESGTYAGWTVEGKALGGKPRDAASTVPEFRADRTFSGYQGRYMVMVGDTRHEKVPPGRLTSSEFTIDRPYLKFWFGGEVHPRVSVKLVVDGTPARSAYGNNSYDMRLRGWDVRELRGRKARLVIECDSDAPALMRLDHFVLSDEPPPPIGLIDEHRQESDVARYGEFRLLYDAGPGTIIDHVSLMQAPDRRWHIFASTMPMKDRYKPEARNRIVHLSAPDLQSQQWTVHRDALTTSKEHGEDFLWDTFVLVHEGTWYLFYTGSGTPWKGWDKNNNWRVKDFGPASTQGPYSIHLATSSDGMTWTRRSKLFTDMPFASTPHVRRIDNEWVMYYAGAEPANVMGKHAVLARRSSDLLNWTRREVVLIDTTETTPWPEHSFFHSPAVVQRGGKWYLIAGPIDNNNQSRFHYRKIFESDDPLRFTLDRHRKGLFLEGGTNIVTSNGQDYVTYSGPYASGIWLAPLYWRGQTPAAGRPRAVGLAVSRKAHPEPRDSNR